VGRFARVALSRREVPPASPFDRYVVDFYCHAAKLVVDPRTAIRGDGKQHEWCSDYDAGRTEVLERMRVRVLRFTNEEVYDDLDSVLARICAELRLPFL
jgi:very-short-patch-repair endonuclease